MKQIDGVTNTRVGYANGKMSIKNPTYEQVCNDNTGFAETVDDLPIIKETVEALAKNYSKPIVVEIQPLSNFYPAEDYHQDYLDKHPDGYCHISPDLFDFARKANKGKASNKPVLHTALILMSSSLSSRHICWLCK